MKTPVTCLIASALRLVRFFAERAFCSYSFHSGKTPPGGFPPSQTPQFIVLTFDDAVNAKTFPDYLHLFQQTKYRLKGCQFQNIHVSFRNPNGCPIRATFFISHEWTNYDSVQWISAQGMELASNSISHVSLADEDSGRWLNEMDGQRRIMAKFAGVPEESIVGMRAPQLAAGADSQFEMMTRAGFIWDNTLSANPGINADPFWPQTLDHRVAWNCHEQGCPQRCELLFCFSDNPSHCFFQLIPWHLGDSIESILRSLHEADRQLPKVEHDQSCS